MQSLDFATFKMQSLDYLGRNYKSYVRNMFEAGISFQGWDMLHISPF